MSIKKIMHKDRYGAQVSIEFGEGGAASQLVEQFLGGMGVPAMQDIPQQHPGGPKGTDTVPAWLTPGEFVMNAEATRMFEPQIEEMNNAGRAVQRQQGGSIPEYKAVGGGIVDYPRDRWGRIIPGGYELANLVSPTEDAAIAALKAGASSEDVYNLSGIQAEMVPYEEPPVEETGTGYRNLLERTEGSGPVSALVQGGLDVGNNISADLKRAGTYLGGTNAPPSLATLAVDAANRAKTGYDPVAAREEQAKLEEANRIKRAKAEEEYNRKNLESRGKGYAGTLGMFGLEVPPVNEDIEAQITAIDKQRVLGQIPDTIAAARIKALRDKETINQIARETAAAGEQKEVASQVSELERQAQLLEDAGYTDDANALREEAAGLTSGTVGPEAEPEDDETTISGLIDAGNQAKEVKTPEGEGVAVTKEPSAWDKVKDFFKEGFGTILDKGALSEAATLYLGSRALGYGHEGSLNFVAKRYGKGIEDKLAIANKAVGTYTPESITKYKDTGNLNDLALIKTLTDLNKPVSYVVPATGEILDYREAKNEKGVTVTVDNQNNVVDTKKLLTADEYRARSEDNRKQLTSLFDGAKSKLTATNKDDEDFDADALFNTAEVAKAASQHALANGFNTAEVSKQAPYIVKFITEAKRSGNPLYKDVSDMDLTNIALTQGIAKSQEPNLFAAGSRGNVDPVLWQSELDLEFPSLRKMYNAPEQALFYKALYKHGYLSRSSEDKKQYDADASEGSNGFLEYIKIHSEEDGPKWKPKFNQLVESYRNPR
jgi:hypothetical protein